MEWSTRLLPLLMLWSVVVGSLAAAAAAAVPVQVGVALDLTSGIGKGSLACISMALDDFYLKHSSYTTRVELRVRDSRRGEVVAAAYAAEELMSKNAEVQAIILPQTTSAELESFAIIANRTNIPILSSSATSLASSSSQARFVVRTAANSSSQAAPIAAILEAFAWRAAVLLHEDSLYGVSILPALVHAFQGYGYRARGVLDSVAVPADAADSRLDAALLAVKSSPASVYVVHMPPVLAARLFHRAMIAGMISEGHVWIATAGVGNAVESLNPGDIGHMQGVVSLRPYVQATDKVRNFSRRFKVRFRQENLATDDAVAVHEEVPVSLLWLYDTAWATAAAAEASLIRTAQGTTLLDALLNTTFHGLAGRFKLVNRQLQISAYEIVNIIGKGARTVGFWTPEFGISTSLYPRTGKVLKQILWPGETAAVPIGWSESPNGRPLRVAVPVKRGFSQFVQISGDPSTHGPMITGYCIDVFHAVMTKLAYPVAYQYVPVNGRTEPYDTLVNLVHEKKADAVAADVTITSSRMKLVSFTVPFADSGWSMIVAEEDKSNSMWIFVKPLTPELWLTSLAFFFFTGFVVWAIEHRSNPRFRGSPWKQFGESNMSKLVVIIWVFAVLILTTSYTASLTSMLTVRQLQPTINRLTERDYVGYQQGSFIGDFLRGMGFDEGKLRGYTTMDEYADALRRGSANGGVTAIFDEVPYLRLFLSRYCEGFSMAGPTYKSGGFGFVFPMGSPLALDVSRAILELAEEEKLARIENKWFGHPGACVSKSNSDEDASSRLELRSFGGLFLINAVVSGLVLLIHLAAFVSQERGELGAMSFPWLRAVRRRFGTITGRHGSGEEERNPGLGAGAREQEATVHDFTSVDASMDASGYGRNAASVPVAEEILPPVSSRGPPDRAGGPETSGLGVHADVA